MWSWFTFWLLLHIMVAITAFGPTFAFPFITRFAQKDPRNALVVTEIVEGIATRITTPAAVVMPFLGLALIYTGHFDLWGSTWLLIAIPLYIVAFFFSSFVQVRNGVRMIEALKALPPPPPGAGGPPPGGPPPHIAQLAKRLQMGGMFVTVLLTIIIVLMIWRPGSAFV